MSYNCKLEYLWLDGYKTPNIRSKTRYISLPTDKGFLDVNDVPEWGFDGSSTEQAEGDSSDCVLKPVSLFNNTVDVIAGTNSYIVVCEVYNVDGTPHKTNTRAALRSIIEDGDNSEITSETWFGIEQEYTLLSGYDKFNTHPYGWPRSGYPGPQGPYYCSVGGNVCFGRAIADAHYKACLYAGINISGTNAEVMPGQWEF